MVITLHRCSYDNTTISSVNKLKQYDASLIFSLLSFSFLICFASLCQICQRVVFLNLLDTKVNPNCLLFHRERERERESPKSSREGSGWVVRWCLKNIQSRSVLLIWKIEGQGSIALAVGAGGVFFSLVYLFSFLSHFWETARYGLKYCLIGPINPKQLIQS